MFRYADMSLYFDVIVGLLSRQYVTVVALFTRFRILLEYALISIPLSHYLAILIRHFCPYFRISMVSQLFVKSYRDICHS
jgi:hypothetical protein